SPRILVFLLVFFFQAEDGIRDFHVTGVQTCALPICMSLANSQVAQQDEGIIVFGFGYRTNDFRFPFGLFGGTKLNNDLNFKLDRSEERRVGKEWRCRWSRVPIKIIVGMDAMIGVSIT